MKAFLIDPEKRALTEFEHDDSLNDLYEQIQCDSIDIVRIDGNDTIYIDDMGLYNKQHFFMFGNRRSPIAGCGVVLGADLEGRSIAPQRTTMESLERDIHWLTREQAIELAKRDDEVKTLMAEGNPGHIVITAADIIEDAEYSDTD